MEQEDDSDEVSDLDESKEVLMEHVKNLKKVRNMI